MMATEDKRREQIDVAYTRRRRASARSLVSCLGHTVINSTPPREWSQVWEPWQQRVMRPLIPAFEQMCGMRADYAGPQYFWYTLPRGHDKTGLLGRLSLGALAFSRHGVRGTAAAADRDQAGLLLESMATEKMLNPWMAANIDGPHRYNVYGAKGSMVRVVSSDAAYSSGLRSDFYVCDEVTVWKSQELWDMLLSGSVKRPNCVFVVITNAGFRESWQWDVLQNYKTDPQWYIYESPQDTMLASWIDPVKVESARSGMTVGHGKRVYDNRWTPVSDNQLLAEDVVLTCVATESPLWHLMTLPRNRQPNPLYVGWDIGRTHDLSVISVVELTPDNRKILRKMIVLNDVSFDAQSEAFEAVMTGFRPRQARIDKGLIGMQLAEHFEKRYPAQVRGVQMARKWMGKAALEMQRSFVRREFVIPNDKELVKDLQGVEEVANSADGLPILNTERDAAGHSDRFWSLALALDCMPQPGVVGGRAAMGRRYGG